MENNLDTEQNSVKNRLLQFLEHKNISQKRFEEMCGLSNGYVNNIRKSIKLDTYKEKIEPIFPELNKKWLLLGEGEMLVEEEEEEPYLRAERNKYGLSLQRIQELTNLPLKTLKAYDNGSKEMPDDILEAFDNLFQRIENEYNEREEENTAIPVLITDDMVSNVKVPFYEVDFAGGFTSPEMFSEVKPSFVISSPSFSGADFACVLTGNSMSRRIKNGSVIGLKKINEWWEYFPTNEIYAIVTKNGLRTVKIVKRSGKSGYIDLIPDPLPEYNNPPYETETIRMEYVIGFYQVVAHAFFERMSF